MENIKKYSTTTTSCNCLAFFYNKNKICKHIKELRLFIMLPKIDFEKLARDCAKDDLSKFVFEEWLIDE